MFIQKRRIVADEELDMQMPEMDGVDVAPEATDLLFEAEDVAELIAEVTAQPVEVEVADDGESVVFAVGEDEFVVEPEGDEEVLEAVRRPLRSKRPVKASRRPVKASRKLPPARRGRVVRSVPNKR